MKLHSLCFPRGLPSRTCASPPQRGMSAVEPSAYAEPTHINCCPFKSRMIVGSAAPIAFYVRPIVFLALPFFLRAAKKDSRVLRRSRARMMRERI